MLHSSIDLLQLLCQLYLYPLLLF